MANQRHTNLPNTRAHPHHTQTHSHTRRHPQWGGGGAARQRSSKPTSSQLPLPVGGRGAGGPLSTRAVEKKSQTHHTQQAHNPHIPEDPGRAAQGGGAPTWSRWVRRSLFIPRDVGTKPQIQETHSACLKGGFPPTATLGSALVRSESCGVVADPARRVTGELKTTLTSGRSDPIRQVPCMRGLSNVAQTPRHRPSVSSV